MLIRDIIIDKIEIVQGDVIQVRRATYIVEDGHRIAGPEYHRVAYSPGSDVSHEDPKIQAIAKALWSIADIPKSDQKPRRQKQVKAS